MKKNTSMMVFVVLALLLVGITFFTTRQRRMVSQNQTNTPPPAPSVPTVQPGKVENTTGLPLSMPVNIGMEIFAQDLPGVRDMVFDSFGNLWVSQTSKGLITSIQIKDGKAESQSPVFKGLKNPHGLAIDNNMLYFAEENKISRVTLYSDDTPHTIADLPSGSGHYTRSLGFGPDGRLYVSIGSSCNVCNEQDARRAAVYSMNKDGSDMRAYATGLRNSVFFAWDKDGKMWATENGRDRLGDNLPPDEINVLSQGNNYGWPVCYGNNIHDTDFDKNVYIQNPCNGKTAPTVELQAHSAPLGLAFVPAGQGWPKDMEGDLLVAYHGSWNSSKPTGYKVVRVKIDAQGRYEGVEDFITGWLPAGATSGPDKSLGRPVQIVMHSQGTAFLSDDKRGVIYKISTNPSVPNPADSTTRIFRNVNIQENEAISNPVSISGETPGSWYFEASFPIKIVDENWNELGAGIAQAQTDWMTTNYVPFTARIAYKKSTTAKGWIVFKKDNPSGLPENDAEYHLPIMFK